VGRADSLHAYHGHERQRHGASSAAGGCARGTPDGRVVHGQRSAARCGCGGAHEANGEAVSAVAVIPIAAACPDGNRARRGRDLRFRLAGILAALSLAAAPAAHAQVRPETPAAVRHYLELTRPIFSGQRAYDQVAFMDQYFRWPGNTGFNASIHRVEDILKA